MRILIPALFVIGCMLTGIMTEWNIQLIKAFSWSPTRTFSSTWFLDISFYLCVILFFVPPILIFFKPKIAGIIGFSITIALSIWQFGLIESVLSIFVYGRVDLTHIFYFFCLLMYLFIAIISGILAFGELKKKIENE